MSSKEQTIQQLHNDFKELVDELYGIRESENSTFVELKSGTNESVGFELGYSKQHFGNLLNYRDKLTIESYHRGIQTLRNIKSVRRLTVEKQELEEELSVKKRQTWNKGHRISFISLLLWGIISLIVIIALKLKLQSAQEQSRLYSNEQTTRKEVKQESEFFDLFQSGGRATADTIASYAYNISQPYLSKLGEEYESLSKSQKIEIITRSHDAIKTILGAARAELAKENYFVIHHKERNVVDFIDHIVPIESCFGCQPEEMLGDALPDCATPYDKQLWSIRNVLFGVDPSNSEADFKEKVAKAVRSAQYELKKEEGRQFRNFIENGTFLDPVFTN
ncbi:hypothetical protein [Lewinella cohaerens]|uniref:hypothetical protein n=1 Tax=Lewinella cohaerens TaxID=70995 RepID=UPI0003659020|nr:hypothetical protein [Lewinella cohaerens]